MKSSNALRLLTEVTASQWGLVTAAQASAHGISRLDLSRLTAAGHLVRLAHGVYKDAGAPSDEGDEVHAAWLSTEPKVMAVDRLKDRAGGVVVAGVSAARLHGIGDLWADRHEFVARARRQSQRAEIRYRQRSLDPHDVTLVHGLPAMSIERTIADLVEEVRDLSLVADALRDAIRQRDLDLSGLGELLSPLAERNGFRKGAGDALLNRLLEIAEVDAETVARRVASDPRLGPLVAAKFLQGLSPKDLAVLTMTPDLQIGADWSTPMESSLATNPDTLAALGVLQTRGVND